MKKRTITAKATMSISGENKGKQMILRVNPATHAWIKNIADETDVTQPNIVSLILGEAIKTPETNYINQIKKLNAKETLLKAEEELKDKQAKVAELKKILAE